MDDCPQQTPLFTFGVIADIQYADIDDGYNFTRTRRRYYRSSLKLLRNARESWSESAVKPEFILQLGDIIDGFNKGQDASDRALHTVLREFSSGPAELHHVWGNHEFYNFSRSALLRSQLNSSLHSGSLHPGSLHPGSLHPDSLHPGSLHPGSLHPGSLHPDSIHPDSLHPGSLHPGSLHPDSIHPDSLHPDSLHPGSLHPDSIHSGSLHPGSLHPDSLHPGSLHSDSLHPDSLHPDSLHSDSLHPDSSIPDSLHPDSSSPDSLHPGSLHPDSIHSGSLHPGSLHPDSSSPDSLHPGSLHPDSSSPDSLHPGSSSRVLGAQAPGSDIYAYSFSPCPGFTFVVLDAYDVSLLGRQESSEQYSQAMDLIKQYNTNEDLNCPPLIEGLQRRFTMFNGGFSKEQLDWLDSILSSADEKQERVTIVSHLPVHPHSTDPICLAWNYEQLLAVVQSHSSVVCFMAGHDHEGGYHQDTDTGVHHVTFEGVIETPPDSNAFATVSVYKDRMELKGRGRIADRVLLFPCLRS